MSVPITEPTETTEALMNSNNECDVDPLNDIIDYLVRCAKISFKNAHVNEAEVHTSDKIQLACNLFKESPTNFLIQFGKHLAPHHVGYFESLQIPNSIESVHFRHCIQELKKYHSDDSRHKRIRNRRYKALEKLKNETDYFSEREMMFRNPLLYEQLVGQYLSEDEIRERDRFDRDKLSFLNIVLESVDQNRMQEIKEEQLLRENQATNKLTTENLEDDKDDIYSKPRKLWGDFEIPDSKPEKRCSRQPRTQNLISCPERKLLREEFIKEMYCSFIEGRDNDVDYHSIDNSEQYDDLQQVSQDAEDQYFDSETNEVENLEEHMTLQKEYGRKLSNDSTSDDPLDVFMKHLNKERVN